MSDSNVDGCPAPVNNNLRPGNNQMVVDILPPENEDDNGSSSAGSISESLGSDSTDTEAVVDGDVEDNQEPGNNQMIDNVPPPEK